MALVKLHNVRIAFFDGFVPKQFDEKSPLKYGTTFLIPKTSPLVVEIKKAIREVAVAKWGAKAEATLKTLEGNANKYCFIDGDSKSYDGFENHWALTAKSDGRPLILDRDKTPLTQSDGKPYGGCYVVGHVDIWIQENKWGKGVRADLKGLQFYKDGDAFAGGRPADISEFDDLSEGASEELA